MVIFYLIADVCAVAPCSVRGVTNMTVVLMPTMISIMITTYNKPFNDVKNKIKLPVKKISKSNEPKPFDIIKIRGYIIINEINDNLKKEHRGQ